MLVLSFSPGFEELIFHPHSGPIFFSELPDLTQSAMVKHFLKIDKKNMCKNEKKIILFFFHYIL